MGRGPPLIQFVLPSSGARPRAPPGGGNPTTSGPGTGPAGNLAPGAVQILPGLPRPKPPGGRPRRPPSMNRKHVERGPGAGRRDRAPATPAELPSCQEGILRHVNTAIKAHTRHLKLSWMNTGLDKREVRERDRQGQGNGERLFFQRHSFVFYWFKMICWSEKVDYRYFYGIFIVVLLLLGR